MNDLRWMDKLLIKAPATQLMVRKYAIVMHEMKDAGMSFADAEQYVDGILMEIAEELKPATAAAFAEIGLKAEFKEGTK